jgi:hypothetical protein
MVEIMENIDVLSLEYSKNIENRDVSDDWVDHIVKFI